jgi:hypothetical protein
VSWYEAPAYAEFAGKSLPNIYTWYLAATDPLNTFPMIAASNFKGHGPTVVGASLAMSPLGAYDMAGNVKEWMVNPSGDKRFILGGGWNESSYAFNTVNARAPMERGESFGFRCASYPTLLPDNLNGPIPRISKDRRNDQPIDSQTLQLLQNVLSYDKTDLKAAVDSAEDAPHWRRENVSFQAAYGNERVIAHLYLPKNVR